MRFVAILLLVGVFVRHNSSYALSALSGYTPSGVFYILGGVWEIVLYAILAPVIWAMERSHWRTYALAGLAIGAIEALQASVCRLLIFDQLAVPRGMPNCNYLLGGWPVGETIMAMYLFGLCIYTGWVIKCRMIRKI